jgi:two-component system response regulator QseB
MKILLVEDDTLLGDGVRVGLSQAGFIVDWLQNGEQALLATAVGHYDVMILDLGLPKIDGMNVLHTLRSRQDNIPVLVLSAWDTLSDRVAGLDGGADDYMGKPFDFEELCARVRALARRQEGRGNPVIEHGNISLDPAGQSVTLDGVAVGLTHKEFTLLLILIENAGRVMSRSKLDEALYSWGEEVESNAIEVHIHHLRKKLVSGLIRNVRGVGYIIDRLT